MRRFIFIGVMAVVLGGAGAAFGGQGATSPNGTFVDLNVAVSPPVAGTRLAPQGVGVSFDSFDGNRIDANRPDTNNSTTVRFNRGFHENGRLFPACTINEKGFSKCAASTQIGTGSAEAEIRGGSGSPPTFIPATLRVYNGKPHGTKAPTLIFLAIVNGKTATEADFRVVQEARGPYGLAFAEIPFPSASPAPFTITKFSVTVPDRTITRRVRGRRVKVHLITAPTTCHGSWKFAQTNTFTDQPPLTATDSQPCVGAR